MPYQTWPKRIERGEQSLLFLAPTGKMWCLEFQHSDADSMFYNLYCEGVLHERDLVVPYLGVCQDFAVTPRDYILAVDMPTTFIFYNKKWRMSAMVQPQELGIMRSEAKDWTSSVGNYGGNPLLFLRNRVEGTVYVGYVHNLDMYSTKWEILTRNGAPWKILSRDELIPIFNAPGKLGAVAHITKEGTAFYNLDTFHEVTTPYTPYMMNHSFFYNMRRGPKETSTPGSDIRDAGTNGYRVRDLNGNPLRRICYSGWTALFDLAKDSYLLKFDAEDIAQTYDGDWLAIEVDGEQVPFDTEVTISGGTEGDIKLIALETLTDILIRCEQPILLTKGTDTPKSVIKIKMLRKGETITLGKVPVDYEAHASSSRRKDFFHITITAEVWYTNLEWERPCCIKSGYCVVCPPED